MTNHPTAPPATMARPADRPHPDPRADPADRREARGEGTLLRRLFAPPPAVTGATASSR
ncbi:hypothetical protein ABZ682_19080 [Streptomyces griseoviridis]|uniref:hypothetical protein n=1 Tax=Streptomyces griseoviridis TaxID=45398 RepID=UPI003404FFA7